LGKIEPRGFGEAATSQHNSMDHSTPGTGFDFLLLGYFVDGVTLSYSFDHLESRVHPRIDGLDLPVLDLHRLDPLAEVGRVADDMNHIPNLKVVAEFEDGHPKPIVIVGNLPNVYLHYQPLSGLNVIAAAPRLALTASAF